MLYESRAAIWDALREHIGEDEGELCAVTITVVTTDADGALSLIHMGFPEVGDVEAALEDSGESEDSGEYQQELGI